MSRSQEAKSKSYKIGNLRAGMRRLNLIARVLKVSKPIHIATSSGFYADLSNAIISDETGTINLSLFGAQMEGVALDDVVQIENAHVAWFRGERQLRIGKRGKINVVNPTANNIEMEQSD
jgi:replication factor A1